MLLSKVACPSQLAVVAWWLETYHLYAIMKQNEFEAKPYLMSCIRNAEDGHQPVVVDAAANDISLSSEYVKFLRVWLGFNTGMVKY